MTLKLAPGLSLPDDTVTQALGILAKRGAGKSNAGAVLAEEMHKAGLQFVAIDPVGAWWGLRSSADGNGAGLPIPVLGGYHGDVPLEPGAGHLIADLVVQERLSCVVDVSAFSEGEKKRFLADFAERLFREKGKPGHEEPLHLFLEEADDYAPQGGTRGGDVGRCLGAFQRIVKQGRARGLGSTMITQRSAALNKDLLTQIDTLIVLRTTSPQDRKAIEGWVTFHDADKDLLESLSGLADGEAWVWSPEALDITKRVQIRRRATFDSGATPKAGAKRRAPKTVADVDLAALEARMHDTIERAKESDPRELQGKIRNLEGRIKELEASPAKDSETVEREVPIEIPRLTDAQFVRVERFMADVFKAMDKLEDTVRTSFEKVLEPVGVWISDEERIDEALGRLKNVGAGVDGAGGGPAGSRRPPKSPVQDASADRAPAPTTRQAAPENDGHVSKSEQRILDALGWLQAANLYPAPRARLGWVAGYKASGGRFNNLLGGMKTAGLIDYPGQGLVGFTEAGVAKARVPDTPLTPDAMQQLVLGNIPPSEGKVLRALIEVYPEELSRDELGARTDYDAGGGRFTNVVGKLRTLGLVEYPMQGLVRAAPVLFLEDR
jgi:uncharacterized protein